MQGFVGDVSHRSIGVVTAFVKQQQNFTCIVLAGVSVAILIVFVRQQALAGRVVPVAVCFAFQPDLDIVTLDFRTINSIIQGRSFCFRAAQPCAKVNMIVGKDISLFVRISICRCIGRVIYTSPQAAGLNPGIFLVVVSV